MSLRKLWDIPFFSGLLEICATACYNSFKAFF